MEAILDFLKSMIEGGFLGQAILATIVWGAIAALLLMHSPVDDRVYDAGFIILGYFFHVAQAASSAHHLSSARLRAEDCEDELQGQR